MKSLSFIQFWKKIKDFAKKNYSAIIIAIVMTLLNLGTVFVRLYQENKTFFNKKLGFGLLFLVFLTVILIGVLFYAKKKSWKIEKKFLICGMIVGMFYCITLPIGSVPDEPAHFWRAYEISNGGVVGEVYEPDNLRSVITVYDDDGYKMELDNISVMPSTNEEVAGQHGATTYTPFNYIPQVIGIWLGKFFRLPLIPMMILSRLLNMVCCVITFYFCIKYIPILKKPLFLMGFFPMMMQQFASVSVDGSIICAGVVLITFVLYTRSMMKRKLNILDFLLLLVSCLVLVLTKPVYIFLCLIVFWIPKERFKSSKHKYKFIISLGVIGGIVMLIKLWLSPMNVNRYGVSRIQTETIFQRPYELLFSIFKTASEILDFYIEGIIGKSLEWFTVETFLPYIIVFLILFAFLCMEWKEKITYGLKLFSMFAFLAISFSIFASMYVIWSQPGTFEVSGVQGRYFLPVLLLIPLACIPAKGKLRKMELVRPAYMYIFVMLANVQALTMILCSHF